ncbi:hypothetical protein ARMGADRAFT_1090634 [Armillaria gallica]|uniref:Uncharacterized protein n=1 Tax=Armillaria gallica TaxID=47427 RepID=A0A2H3CSB3_ARMGA|nr:hypothetical protein ARMGADRAFT_1090634 [Armillaria gallica]
MASQYIYLWRVSNRSNYRSRNSFVFPTAFGARRIAAKIVSHVPVWTSPLPVCESAINHPRSNFIEQPLSLKHRSCTCFRMVLASFRRTRGTLRLCLAGIYGTGVKMERDLLLHILQSSATISSSNGSFHRSLLTVILLDCQEGSEGDEHFGLCLDLLERWDARQCFCQWLGLYAKRWLQWNMVVAAMIQRDSYSNDAQKPPNELNGFDGVYVASTRAWCLPSHSVKRYLTAQRVEEYVVGNDSSRQFSAWLCNVFLEQAVMATD